MCAQVCRQSGCSSDSLTPEQTYVLPRRVLSAHVVGAWGTLRQTRESMHDCTDSDLRSPHVGRKVTAESFVFRLLSCDPFAALDSLEIAIRSSRLASEAARLHPLAVFCYVGFPHVFLTSTTREWKFCWPNGPIRFIDPIRFIRAARLKHPSSSLRPTSVVCFRNLLLHGGGGPTKMACPRTVTESRS